MERFEYWLARSPIASAVKIGLAYVIGVAVVDWSTAGRISFDNVETWLIGAFAVAGPILINALNPHDDRYGAVEPTLPLDDPGDDHYPAEQS
jgi:hypothetical protein